MGWFRMSGGRGVKNPCRDSPVSQICALMVFSSIDSVLVANSTPMVDLESRLNSLRVNLDKTARIRRLKRILSEATKILWTYGFCWQGCLLVSTVISSSSSKARYARFPNPGVPNQNDLSECFRFAGPFLCLLEGGRRTLKRKSKLLLSAMDAGLVRVKKRSR
jgi:hypothetical protein